MTESSVSSPLMKQLRAELTGAIVIKHHDGSMIGLPDCSITYHERIMWLEFKLIVPPKWKQVNLQYLKEMILESPTQYAMMMKLRVQTAAWYVFWVKKSKRIIVYDPLFEVIKGEFADNPGVVRYLSLWLNR